MVQANPPGGGSGRAPHNHGSRHIEGRDHPDGVCNCAEEAKNSDPTGDDLYPCIDMGEVECFNEAQADSVKQTIRPLNERLDFRENPALSMKADLDYDMVVRVQFNSEVKVKAIKVAGGPDGTSPNTLRIYKNEATPDFDII